MVDGAAEVRSIAAAMAERRRVPGGRGDIRRLGAGPAGAGRPNELVLADIAMLGINGVEFAPIVHRTWPAVPVGRMAGYADDDLPRRGANHAVLRKPFGAAELVETVGQAVARSRSGGG